MGRQSPQETPRRPGGWLAPARQGKAFRYHATPFVTNVTNLLQSYRLVVPGLS